MLKSQMIDLFTFPSFIDITIIITVFLGKYRKCANFLKIQTRNTDEPLYIKTVLGTDSTLHQQMDRLVVSNISFCAQSLCFLHAIAVDAANELLTLLIQTFVLLFLSYFLCKWQPHLTFAKPYFTGCCDV